MTITHFPPFYDFYSVLLFPLVPGLESYWTDPDFHYLGDLAVSQLKKRLHPTLWPRTILASKTMSMRKLPRDGTARWRTTMCGASRVVRFFFFFRNFIQKMVLS